jgi:hypothetical protein
MRGVLVVVPCGKAKVWDREPRRGATPARDAYTGGLFRAHRAYAERIGERWVVLSAKYGLIDPDWLIPGPYDVTFNNLRTRPVGADRLRCQAAELGLDRFPTVVGLGGAVYRAILSTVFDQSSARLVFPFEGLNLFRIPGAVRRATAEGTLKAAEATVPTPPREPDPGSPHVPRREDFHRVLEAMLAEGAQQGLVSVDLTAGEVHRRVGNYPGPAHRMPICCSVMRSAMGPTTRSWRSLRAAREPACGSATGWPDEACDGDHDVARARRGRDWRAARTRPETNPCGVRDRQLRLLPPGLVPRALWRSGG